MFREHHYLSKEFNNSADVFLCFWGETLVAMASVLAMPSGNLKFAMRQHRLVVLPDYQNLGIGTKLNDFLAEYYVNLGYKYFIRTAHPRLARHLANDMRWVETAQSNKVRTKESLEQDAINCTHGKRFGDLRKCYSYEYFGNEYVTKPKKEIIVDKIKSTDALREYLIKEKETHYMVVVTGFSRELRSEVEDICMKLGIRTELLYFVNKQVKVRNKRWENTETYTEPKDVKQDVYTRVDLFF